MKNRTRWWTVMDENGKLRADVVCKRTRRIAECNYVFWREGDTVKGWMAEWRRLSIAGCRAVKVTLTEGWDKT